MHKGLNNSLETLLSRHYGDAAPVPVALEPQLYSSLRHQSRETQQQQHNLARLYNNRFGRRRAVRLVALSSAGLALLSIGMEGLQMLESALANEEVTQSVFP